GLIIGGVLVGQDLITQAKLRAQVAQFNQFDAAVNAFRLKYDNLPGDISSANATAFGFTSGNGDEDGLIEGTADQTGEEVSPVFMQLSEAGFIPNRYAAGEIPITKMERGWMSVTVLDNTNNWAVGVVSTGATWGTAGGFTGFEAWSIDNKVDDGMPNLGNVQAEGNGSAAATDATSAADTTNCVSGATATDTYVRSDTAGNVVACPLRVRING
ncbi:MAG: hypothetical protein KDD76_01745, partial [Rickettsiales bacterium]|nr:hypothetical protein [Rickettsiales bacterium]